MPAPQEVEAEDKDLPLREDIRPLGRILGDTVREQAGAAVFDTVQSIRQNAVRFHRDEDAAARRELAARAVAADRQVGATQIGGRMPLRSAPTP